MRALWTAALAAVLVVASFACEPAPPATPGRISTHTGPPLLSLETAIRQAHDLGPAGPGVQVSLSLALKAREPDPVLVQGALRTLRSGGLVATWRPPSSLIAVDGPAPRVAALFAVGIESYRLRDGATFYASLDTPRLPPAISAVVSSVTGLDNYQRAGTYAVRPGGLLPSDVLSFYNLKALRNAGLDGSGQTIVLPEIDDLPNLNDLNRFASRYGLPPYDQLLTIKRDPGWGTPVKPVGETVLDLEIIHEVAPNAKLVIYLAAPDFAHSDRAFDQLVTDHLGSVISESLGACEPLTPRSHRDLYSRIQDRAVAQGMGHYVASGDSGAYTCGQAFDPAGSFPSTLPSVTSIGGTSVFQSREGAYFKETAWGSPIDESGTGGGASVFYPLPDYQRSVSQAAGHGRRQVPDVSAASDPNTGFHIIFGGHEGQAGGTSAAAPLWAATVALINQDLQRKGLRETGFANPALYWMGENASKLPARPFHDVTTGNNLAYSAGPGWDFATGWGSMDGAALDAAWILYIKGRGV